MLLTFVLLVFLLDQKNRKFGIQSPQNPCSGLYQGLFAGLSLIAMALIQVVCLPFLVVSSAFEKFADGLRFGEHNKKEKSYDDIDGLMDGILEGFKSLYFGLKSAVVCGSGGGGWMRVIEISVGVVTKPVGGVLDMVGKSCEGGLRCCRVKKGRHRGQLKLTKMQQNVVKKGFASTQGGGGDVGRSTVRKGGMQPIKEE